MSENVDVLVHEHNEPQHGVHTENITDDISKSGKMQSMTQEPKVFKPLPQTFKKGQSGNPAGKPKGLKSMTTIVREYFKSIQYETAGIDGKVRTIDGESAIAETLLKLAVHGQDKEAIRMIWQFIDGMPKQSNEVAVTRKGYEISDDDESGMLNRFALQDAVDVEAVAIDNIDHENNSTQSEISDTTDVPGIEETGAGSEKASAAQ